jgi:dihydroxyacetone kinase
MKKIINKPETVVPDMLSGLVFANPGLSLDRKYKVVTRKQNNPDKVNLISGGGSGHEPAHAGFVGTGMLDAAVCGDVFASPSQIQIYQAIKATASSKGNLLIIKNYSGDMMNFKNAAFLAAEDGLTIDYVKVDDDIAVQDSLYTVGRRGVAGTVFVHKIAGAAAELGMDLAQVKAVAEKTVRNVRSLGFAFTSCTVPAKGTATFTLDDDELEYGVGIHGEPGIKREKVLSSDDLAKRMTTAILADLQLAGQPGAEVALLINGFGATPLQELYGLTQSVARELDHQGIIVLKTLVGNYMTSIDMAGASISILHLDEELKVLLAEPCDTPGLKLSGRLEPCVFSDLIAKVSVGDIRALKELSPDAAWIKDNCLSLENLIYMVDCMGNCIIRNEVPFCDLDSHAGDGDFGMSVAKGFRQLKQEWQELLIHRDADIGSFLEACSLIIMEHCGGASGPIWGSAFRAAGRSCGKKTSLSLSEFAEMMQAAVVGIQKTGERSFGRGATIGDKTLMDALIPCTQSLAADAAVGKSFGEALQAGAKAAQVGAKSTELIVARMGRAGTVGERSLGYPDAGAFALGVIFQEVADSMKA